MDDLLTPVSTTYLKPRIEPQQLLTEVKPDIQHEKITSISTPDEALDALKSQPDYDTLVTVLKFLNDDRPTSDGFSFQTPNPKSAAIVHLLVSEIAPNYYTLLVEGAAEHDGSEEQPHVELLLRCLRSSTGLNATMTQIRAHIQEARLGGKEEKRIDIALNLGILLDMTASLLRGLESIRAIWASSVKQLTNADLQRVQSQKLGSLLTNGQIVSVSAEALEIVGRDRVRDDSRWIADGLAYSRWIGNSIVSWVKSSPVDEEATFCADVFQKSLSLHHSGKFV